MRARRLGRLATKLLPRLQAHFQESGIQPQSIPDNIWAPALEPTALVDVETLQDKWAALLVNAVNPDTAGAIQVCFIDILRQLSPIDAKYLDALYETSLEGSRPNLVIGADRDLYNVFDEHVLPANETSSHIDWETCLQISLNNLLRARLIDAVTKTKFPEPANGQSDAVVRARDLASLQSVEEFAFTGLGLDFVQACRRPSRPASANPACQEGNHKEPVSIGCNEETTPCFRCLSGLGLAQAVSLEVHVCVS